MTFDETEVEVGKEYWFCHKNLGQLRGVFEDQEGGWVILSGSAYVKSMISNITPVPDRETWEACLAALEAADNELWRLTDPETLPVHKQIRAALAKARGE